MKTKIKYRKSYKKVQHSIYNAASCYLINPYFKAVENKDLDLPYLSAMVEEKKHDIWREVQHHDKRRKNMSDAVNEVHACARGVIFNRISWDAEFKSNLNEIRTAQTNRAKQTK